MQFMKAVVSGVGTYMNNFTTPAKTAGIDLILKSWRTPVIFKLFSRPLRPNVFNFLTTCLKFTAIIA